MSSPRSESNRRQLFTGQPHDLRAAGAIEPSGRRDSNPSDLPWQESAAPSGLVREYVPPAGLAPATSRVRVGHSTLSYGGNAAATRATPWNRTRTSRSSAERADLLRKSGVARRYGNASRNAVFGCHAPSAPCRWRSTVSECSGNRRFTGAAAGTSSAGHADKT